MSTIKSYKGGLYIEILRDIFDIIYNLIMHKFGTKGPKKSPITGSLCNVYNSDVVQQRWFHLGLII